MRSVATVTDHANKDRLEQVPGGRHYRVTIPKPGDPSRRARAE